MAPFRVSIKKAGYHFVDWNDLTGDAEGQNISVNKLLNNIKNYTKGKEHVVILMHDAPDKETTVQALPQVIEYLKAEGYSFYTLK
jgi:peptidoglycan/xylan/chitin deacetylase (PgdA/CDA1 family)